MWDTLPWFVQLAIDIGAILFLYTVAIEAVIRTIKLVVILKFGADAVKAVEALHEPKAEKSS